MKQIQCKVFGHNFKVSRNVTLHIKEYTCANCKKQFTINSKGDIVELTSKIKEINDVLEHYYSRKNTTSRIRLKTNQPLEGLLLFSH